MKLTKKKINKNSKIFFDYASITPLHKLVAKEMERVQSKFWGNPSSLHSFGEDAKNVLEDARKRVAHLMQAKSKEIFFTSGGTESLNIAILGVISATSINTPHIIVSSIEHPSVLEPIKFLLKNKKIEVSFLNPNEEGIINPESIKRELKENTVLVIIQHANNEIGVIQPVHKISGIIKEYKKNKSDSKSLNTNNYPYFLVDASQSALYEGVSIERLGADMLVLDGIKIYGPRGFGILVAKYGLPIEPLIRGGGQEGGLRSGTQNVASASGFALALEIAFKMKDKESARLIKLRDYALKNILQFFPKASLNGSLEHRLPNNINICFPNNDSEFLVIKLDTLGFAVSAASACHTLSLENSSYVIESLGKTDCGASSLRFTFGSETKKKDIDKLLSALKKIIK